MNSNTIDRDNVEKLTDEELFKALKECGFNVGPITPTTKSLYQRRLKNHLENNSTSPSIQPTVAATSVKHPENSTEVKVTKKITVTTQSSFVESKNSEISKLFVL